MGNAERIGEKYTCPVCGKEVIIKPWKSQPDGTVTCPNCDALFKPR